LFERDLQRVGSKRKICKHSAGKNVGGEKLRNEWIGKRETKSLIFLERFEGKVGRERWKR
jgi:hypothetical protein